ncbi:putative phosphatase regulatory subunit-domain-containing protein [Xylariaceae sp. FL0255]|nr:putative phosphatase regulatory subunit-domain-containing protein [Xylariaceae sp. FL0255]
MPYTPPSHRSPATSAPASPDASRRPSFAAGAHSHSPSPSRPSLPRSASYLTKHRRTPSAPTLYTNGSTPDITPPGTSADLKALAASQGPVRQSPPPVADASAMPPGAVISPPESSSEDEGIIEMHQRGREIENMKELKEAISAIPQCRTSSPERTSPGDLLMLPTQTQQQLLDGPQRPAIMTTGLKPESRKILHSRSNTDSNIYFTKSADASLTASEDSEQDEPIRKPPMVRKKSGELVRPALRPAALRRPSSMPGTPTFASKAVHFDSHLEHVRHFLQVDRPLAVSAGSSPADNYDSDTEYPFKNEDKAPRSPPYEWEIVIPNFPADTPIRKGLPVRLERVWMSPDQKSLVGSISVANLAFQKFVVCRFTFDYWKTTSEVGAEFHHEIRLTETATGNDRFQFSIKLSDIADLQSKTLYFCIRYNVNGVEYWDNNGNMNFQVDFRKKMLPQNGKKGFQGASSRPASVLPRSNRRTSPSPTARPRSMPIGSLDDFEHDAKLNDFDQPLHEFLGETEPLRLKSSKSTTSIPSDNLSSRLTTPSGVAFANRYDFGASLSAAKQAQKSSGPSNRDGLYMKAHKRAAFSTAQPTEVPESPMSPRTVVPPPSSLAQVPAGPAVATEGPSNLGTDSPSSIASASYEEILNKYCFFNGSKQSSPQLKDGTLRSGRYDGVDELNQALHVADQGLFRGSPQSRQNLTTYFHNVYISAMGPSSESPLQHPPLSSSGSPDSPDMGSNRNYVTSSASTDGFGSDQAQYHTQQMQDRFPFMTDSHAARAIKS